MKVNDLKALYEKAGTIKAQVNPIHNKTAPSIPHFDSSQPSQPVQTLPAEVVIEAVKEQPRKSMVKNNDFLNELNKKLMTKSVKPKKVETEEPKLTEIKQQIPIVKEVEPVIMKQEKIEPLSLPSAPTQGELSFDDIMCDLGQQKVNKSTLKARYGINERHPTTREEELIFTELEEQRKSEIRNSQATQKENAGTEAVSYLRRPKPKPQTFHQSVAYSKFKTDERIKRIDRIIDQVFGSKLSQTVINKQRIQNMKKQQQKKEAQRQSQPVKQQKTGSPSDDA